MGGGPRTFPGGVTKWQWKRMQVKRREEAEQRRLVREKTVYQMRRRAEVLAVHPELQQPWEKLATFPPPGVTAQQQLARLARRFDRPAAAEDLWDHKDGPQRKAEAEYKQEEEAGPPIAAAALNRMEEPPLPPFTTRRHMVHNKAKNKKEASSLGKNMQDYLDSFESDPLGLAAERATYTKGNRRSY